MMMLHVVAFIAKPPLHTVIPPICRQTFANPQIYEGLPTIPQPAVSGGLTPKLLLWSYQATGHYGNRDHVWKCWSFAWQAWDVNGKDLLETNKALFKHKHAWIFWFLLIDWWNNANHMQYTTLCQKYAEEHQNQKNTTKQKHNKIQQNPTIFNVFLPSGITERRPIFFSSLFLRDSRSATNSSNSWIWFIPSLRSKSPSCGYIHLWMTRREGCWKTIKNGQKWWVPPWKNRNISPKPGKSEDQVLFICLTVCLRKCPLIDLQAPASSSREDCYAQQELFPAYLL